MLQSLKQIWTASIRRQLMLGIAMVHAVLMTIFVFDLVSRQSSFLVDESRKQATSLAETLAANGTSWVLANDYIGMEEVIHSQHSFPGLHYAMFTDLHGQVLAFTDREQVGRYASDPISVQLIDSPSETRVLIDNQLLIDVAHPIMIKQRHIGWARVGISRAGIASNLEVVTNEGLLYTVLAIAVGVLFAWVMSRGLTQDTRRLAAFANRIESGERKEHCLLDRPDELGQLAYDMNRMLDTLVEREQEVVAMHTQILADEERLRYALEGSNDGLWDWDIINDQVYYSPRWKEMLGYRSQEVANTFASWEERVHQDDLPKALASIDAHMLDASKSLEILHRLRHKDGSWRWILSRARALRNTQGKPYRMVGTHVDVTEQKRLETVLSEERERALVTLHSIGDGVITTFADARIDYLNSVAEILTGWSKEDAHLRSLEEVFPIVDEVTRKPIDNPVERCLREGKVVGLGNHTLLINRKGKEISIEDSAAPIRNSLGQVNGVVLVFHDVSEARLMQRKIEHQAMHDGLTGLWSRSVFDHRLSELTQEALQGEGEHVLVYIDLDQFKVVNDTVGHVAGDELLKQVATLLQQHSRGSDLLARLGGDEFGLLLIGCDIDNAVTIAEQLRVLLAEFPFTWENHHFQIGASFGIALVNSDLPDPNALSLADLACYSAKDQGRNRVHVYQPDDQELTERRSEMQWVARIKSALNEERFILYSQRILSLSREANKRDFREVLVRMVDEDGQIVAPGQFIPAAERYDIMTKIDEIVLRRACEWLMQPQNTDVHLSINLSGGSLGNRLILNSIEQQLTHNPELGQRICFEITETAAIGNLREALAFMRRLKKRRVSFALDDFGSGLSSFSYLKTLPVDYLKIDGCFVRDLLDDPIDAAMVESISRVSKEMGIETIAEFVENQDVLEWLTVVGVDYGQGYGIEKPRPL
ncbi:MAG: EAL domain-containing protein [Candidatus Thiodiazotropha sp. (ex Cardiolucina cf. quadrata)]|nr:EAL domain-containing protein [Candidatus Thiodiazotropha sp. (ex Cardiolucina cf. quadrata)]